MNIDDIIKEAESVAADLNLSMSISDITDNACSLRIIFRDELFIQVYANRFKNKVNFAIIQVKI